jgi:hypothetical protein
MEMVRYCPACDDEFRPDITLCSDCGGELILQPEGVGALGVDGSSSAGSASDWRNALDALPVSSLTPLRTFDSLDDLEPAVAALAEIRLPSRVLVQNGRYILLVQPETLGDAQATLHGAQVDADDAVPGAFDATAGRYEVCPACDTRLAPDFGGTCPECGLELSAPGGDIKLPEAE